MLKLQLLDEIQAIYFTICADVETVIGAEFSAVNGKLNDEGTLVIIKEEIYANA